MKHALNSAALLTAAVAASAAGAHVQQPDRVGVPVTIEVDGLTGAAGRSFYYANGFVVSPPLIDAQAIRRVLAAVERSYAEWCKTSKDFEKGTKEYRAAYDKNDHDKKLGWGFIFQDVIWTLKNNVNVLGMDSGDLSRFMASVDMIKSTFASADEKGAFDVVLHAVTNWVNGMGIFAEGWSLNNGAAIGSSGVPVIEYRKKKKAHTSEAASTKLQPGDNQAIHTDFSHNQVLTFVNKSKTHSAQPASVFAFTARRQLAIVRGSHILANKVAAISNKTKQVKFVVCNETSAALCGVEVNEGTVFPFTIKMRSSEREAVRAGLSRASSPRDVLNKLLQNKKICTGSIEMMVLPACAMLLLGGNTAHGGAAVFDASGTNFALHWCVLNCASFYYVHDTFKVNS
jgi:hypothetical protein